MISLTLIIVIGSSLAAPVSWVAKWLAGVLGNVSIFQSGALGSIRESMAESPFTRYYDRAILIATVGVLFSLRSWFGLGRKEGWSETRIAPRFVGGWGGAFYQALGGFLIAGACLMALALVYVALSIFHPKNQLGSELMSISFISASVVGLLEEALFRGFILAILLKSMRVIPAIIFLTLLFAVLHFVHPPEENLPRVVSWIDGWKVTGASLARLVQPQYFVAELCTLIAVGWVLVSLRFRSGSIWFGVGIHAGWVFALKEFSRMMKAKPDVLKGEYLPWIGENLRTGIAPLLCILLTWLLATLWLKWSNKQITTQI